MCTVTYVPISGNDFILTSNRDEDPGRITVQPGSETTITQSDEIVCPRDSKAGGTWVAMSKSGRVACLLNGAFIKHKHQPPYNRSRGLIVLEYFSYTNAERFMEQVNLDGVENFTLVLCDIASLFEFRWDGSNKHIKQLDKQSSYIWSSCTLYDEETSKRKEAKFNIWLEDEEQVVPEKLSFFHGLNNPDGFLLNHPKVKTVSITSVAKTNGAIKMDYFDLLSDSKATTGVTIEN